MDKLLERVRRYMIEQMVAAIDDPANKDQEALEGTLIEICRAKKLGVLIDILMYEWAWDRNPEGLVLLLRKLMEGED